MKRKRATEKLLNACRAVHLCFVPHEKNNFLPHAAQHKVLFGYSFLILMLKVASLLLLVFLPAASIYSSTVTSANITALTNAARTNIGLSELAMNGLLNVAAQAKAEDMLTNQYFAHTSPQGKTPWFWINSVGYNYQYAGENLAVHYFQAEDVQSAWMASPSHRKNILDERFTEVGVGIVQGSFEDYNSTIVVQMFGTPKGAVTDAAESTEGSIEPEEVVSEPESEQEEAAPPQSVEREVAGEQDIAEEKIALITPDSETGDLKVEVALEEDVKKANIINGHEVVTLEEGPEGVFTGTLSTEGEKGESLILTSESEDSSYNAETIGILQTEGDAVDLYVVTEPERKKLFGFISLSSFNDGIALFYTAAAILISALLLLTVLVRFEKQNHSVTAHLLVVLILTAILIAM